MSRSERDETDLPPWTSAPGPDGRQIRLPRFRSTYPTHEPLPFFYVIFTRCSDARPLFS
jgi:hypothetical protein